VDPARDAAAVFSKAGADVSVREAGRQVRVSPALFNTADDIDHFLAVARAVVAA
jgi:selenocysteine lyase/cysteine desulfurase